MHRLRCSVLFIFLGLTQVIYSLPSDRQKPVDVRSDSAQIHHFTRTGVYRGHVIATQGTTQLTADQVIAKLDADNQLQSLVALGTPDKPATFATIPHVHDQAVVAHAQKIAYTPANHQVRLSENAWVAHEKDSYHAQLIDYDTLTQSVQTPGSAGGVTIVINPKS